RQVPRIHQVEASARDDDAGDSEYGWSFPLHPPRARLASLHRIHPIDPRVRVGDERLRDLDLDRDEARHELGVLDVHSRTSSAARARLSARYTIGTPSAFHRPGNRRAPSPSIADLAYFDVTTRQAEIT
ncbi:MAG: hypothetical protein RLN75_08630, partial [Longimicrobiales bacterium]